MAAQPLQWLLRHETLDNLAIPLSGLMKTTAVFFPFDLFGSPGTSGGAELLADAFGEMLADNAREQTTTRAAAYEGAVRVEEIAFDTIGAYQSWRKRGRRLARRILARQDFLLWVTGNHAGVLPVYEELGKDEQETLVIQLDAHLDIHRFTDCTPELSHGNFLLHASGTLPKIINVGHRDLLLLTEDIRKHYQTAVSAEVLALRPEAVLTQVRRAARRAKRVFVDIDCDVLDPSFFPAVTHPLPLGLHMHSLVRLLDAVWSERVIGVALSEFDPGRDQNDRCLSSLAWLLEYLLLKRHERPT
jgi:arginase family enzyme